MTITASTTGSSASTGSVTAVGAGATLVALTCTAYGAHTWSEIGVVAVATTVCAALVFGVVVPTAIRKQRPGRTALWLSVPALLILVPAFWSGLPMVLGAAGALLGNAGRRTHTGAGQSTAGLVLGALAVIGYLMIYVSEAVNVGGGFLFA